MQTICRVQGDLASCETIRYTSIISTMFYYTEEYSIPFKTGWILWGCCKMFYRKSCRFLLIFYRKVEDINRFIHFFSNFSLYPRLIKRSCGYLFWKFNIERCISSRIILEKWLMVTSRWWIFVKKKKKEKRNIVKQIEVF